MNALGFTDLAGPWRHFEGGRYVVIGVAETHENKGDLDVVYLSLTRGNLVTMPLRRDSRNQDSWCDIVRWPDAKERERFVRENALAENFMETLFNEKPEKSGVLARPRQQ